MRALLITIFSGCLFFQVMAQTEVENQLISRVHELQKAGIDTIVHFRENFGGMFIPLDEIKKDSCYAVDKMYLFWLKNGKAYIQRFDNCLKHAPVRINPYFITTFSSYVKNIKAENILPAQYEEPLFLGMFKNKVTLFVAHCGYIKFKYYQRGNSFEKEFNDYGLYSK
ncbi:hypothetical protein [Mucilaginibacter terrae]|uniref:Uncharacterized protein n=1 Tax=Mucilaginibacter terrae TaxID=1955052 RepID=A0ABU3GVX7_9SPHI|nr:hypothetical protein [Mucilaginibacter terrae]MDT3403921.1 hypothetical protein [Mucilaginibacter terrae]